MFVTFLIISWARNKNTGSPKGKCSKIINWIKVHCETDVPVSVSSNSWEYNRKFLPVHFRGIFWTPPPPSQKKVAIKAPFPLFRCPAVCFRWKYLHVVDNEMPLHTARPLPISSCKAPDGLGSRGLRALTSSHFFSFFLLCLLLLLILQGMCPQRSPHQNLSDFLGEKKSCT